jgi:hypothetical protein
MVDLSDRDTGTGGPWGRCYLTGLLQLTTSSQRGNTRTDLLYLTGVQHQYAIVIRIFPRFNCDSPSREYEQSSSHFTGTQKRRCATVL